MRHCSEFRKSMSKEAREAADKIFKEIIAPYKDQLPLYCGPGSDETNTKIAEYDGKYKERFLKK